MARLPTLLLDIAGTTCALPRAEIREILPLPRLHAPPAAGGPLVGFLNLAGEPVPVIDLAALFALRDAGSGRDPYRHVVLARGGDIAFLVDRALDLVQVEEESLRPVESARSLNGCVIGEFARGDSLVHLLSLDRILTLEERTRLDALTRQATTRLARFEPEGARAV
ncbi:MULTISPECIES: chemotaxis protein CheW [Methylorubrum]|uniref:chemotaxis protein CheW n=1 Tax=Methylorubrum TaxID=2282523 RepID=UPI0020A12E33|nr:MULTISPECIES: chemotaxis protein CheW [Methylorubrum]MCP1548722.1 purine-binding chemotaxis protein CheW [Methylorubrum zatmanii]MCP1554665.1 purine-binding chemotaxis protein CheW [Methylorubrum extorquens]MCP1579025.1 purine-binding chemotaxis protein CheW [Methylorubrum extorquens]